MLSSWVTGTHPPSGPTAGALGAGTKPPRKTQDASSRRAGGQRLPEADFSRGAGFAAGARGGQRLRAEGINARRYSHPKGTKTG